MRGCTMLAFCALAALTAVPDTADARSPFSVLTSPLRSVMRAVPGLGGRRLHHRRVAARAYRRKAIKLTAVERTTAVERSPGGGATEGGRTTRPSSPAPHSMPTRTSSAMRCGRTSTPIGSGPRLWRYHSLVLTPSAVTAAISEDGTKRPRHRKRPAKASDADVAGGLTASGMCGGAGRAGGRQADRAHRPDDRPQRCSAREPQGAARGREHGGRTRARRLPRTLPATSR